MAGVLPVTCACTLRIAAVDQAEAAAGCVASTMATQPDVFVEAMVLKR